MTWRKHSHLIHCKVLIECRGRCLVALATFVVVDGLSGDLMKNKPDYRTNT